MPLGRDLRAPLGSTLPLLSSMFFFCVSFQIPHLFLSVFVRVYLRIEFLTDRNFVMQFDCHRRAIHDHSSLFLSLCVSLSVYLSPPWSLYLFVSLSVSTVADNVPTQSCALVFRCHPTRGAVIVPQVVEDFVNVLNVLAFRTKFNDVPSNLESWKTWSLLQTCSRFQISSDRNDSCNQKPL